MTVTRNIDKLDSAEVFVHQAIKATSVEKLLQFLNALREGLTDSVAPGGGTQLYTGHDHSDEGGAPIIRGCQLTYDSYATPVFEKTDFLPGDLAHAWRVAPAYISPGLATYDGSTRQQIAICYQAIGSFALRSGLGEWVSVESTGETDIGWVFVERPIVNDGTWEDLYIDIRPVQGTEFRVYSVNLVETYQASQPNIGVRDVQTATSARTFLRYFGEELADELAEDSLNADTLKRIFSACNALLECTIDRSAPGASSQSIQGHDHYSSGQLGRAIGRGKVFSAGGDLYLGGGGTSALWICDATVLNQWEYADKDCVIRRTTSGSRPGGTATTAPMFVSWGTVGITSSGSPPSSTPYIEAWIYVEAETTSAVVEVRLYNMTHAAYSQTITFNGISELGTWKYIRYVPGKGNDWNEWNIQVRHTVGVGGTTGIYVRAIVIAESQMYNGNNAAYVASSGGRLLGVPQSGVIKVPA